MPVCGFCEELPTEGFFYKYCEECAMLRRMLKLHEPKKCVDVLKRVFIRNEEQMTRKIQLEIKNNEKKACEECEKEEGVKTRSKTK